MKKTLNLRKHSLELPKLIYNGEPALAPQEDDLNRLYRYIRGRVAGRVLEFGCGYSTVVIAIALRENEKGWGKNYKNTPFISHVIDTDEEWMNHVKEKLEEVGLAEKIRFILSGAKAGIHDGQMCSYYDTLTNMIPDFIYIDGPDPDQVEGSVHGMDFKNSPWRQVMSADPLLMEPYFYPKTAILVDGRHGNARFLRTNFKRNWEFTESLIEGYTFMELIESGELRK